MNFKKQLCLGCALLLTAGSTWASPVACKSPFREYGWQQHAPSEIRDRIADLKEWEYDDSIPTSAGDDVVFETVQLFRKESFFTEPLYIDTAGTYRVTLTDFEFPKPLNTLAINITTASESLVELFGPGTTTFEAGPGDYFLSLLATTGPGGPYNEHAMKKFLDESMPWYAHGAGGRGGFGQYGVEISLVSAVPVPAAIWMFISGLLGVAGIGWRRRAASLRQ